MDYKLFDDYITLQALLKEVGIIQSGGAIKAFLAENQVYFNDELENRRGKKIRVGDVISIPAQEFTLTILEPSLDEKQQHQEEQAEKTRVANMVKEMNRNLKKTNIVSTKKIKNKQV
ncbi:S4 domain protein YaaA [Streptococcus sp. oral taxon 056 str. F0418]|uniref:S4 domain-containing protein YaaA n=1 Tax=Streptococcus sp. oral taxon 056 TaxID=712620 RepID=UPI000218072D|nr:S4 domain-containing protein YaaA [Streptococcus sp. oral taxon 056]EGP66509.1 S4 domain protein YaaA [Streptococcus sp. oral taxon 056 str. F0418]